MKSLWSFLMEINENPLILRMRDSLLYPLGYVCIRLKVHPIIITSIGSMLGFLCAISVSGGHLQWGALFLVLSLVLDGLDGFVARRTHTETRMGAFLDGVFDRYVDLFVLGAFAWYFAERDVVVGLFFVGLSVLGTTVTSYVTPHALSLQLTEYKQHVGFFGRVQRLVVLILGLMVDDLLLFSVVVVAVLSNLTALHRIIHFARIERQLKSLELSHESSSFEQSNQA